MHVEHFIARRYLHSKRQLGFIRIIMLVSVTGITVGVAALVIVLSVFNGFNSVVTGVLVGFDPHLRVEPVAGKALQTSAALERELRADPRIHAWAPFVSGKVLLQSASHSRVVFLRGVVDTLADRVSGVPEKIVLGEFRLREREGRTGIVLGLTLADRLGAVVGTELTVVSPVGVDAVIMGMGQPLMRTCVVTGIYDSNNKEYDAQYAFVDLELARTLFAAGAVPGGVEMRLHDIADAQAVRDDLARAGDGAWRVLTWYDLHRDLYSVMQIERWAAYIILCLIVGVATFNVLGSLTMGVIEKRRDIGVLRALGATRGAIVRVFMFEGILVGTIGTVFGVALGLLVCWLQIRYHLFPLDPTVYIIPALPVDVRWTDFVAVGGASMLLSTLASLYPALRAARSAPAESLRWE